MWTCAMAVDCDFGAIMATDDEAQPLRLKVLVVFQLAVP